MPEEISLREAKAKLSSLVRRAREGRTMIITVHGEPAAELRPIDRTSRKPSIEERMAELDASGALSPARLSPQDPHAFPPGIRAPGALARFLENRD